MTVMTMPMPTKVETRPRMADDPLVQSEYSKRVAALAAAEAYVLATVSDVYGRAEDDRSIGLADRANMRLCCTHAVQSGIEAANWVHHAAGVSAIFPESAFERRFRDMHTLSQQIQARASHWAAIGHVLLGGEPAVFY